MDALKGLPQILNAEYFCNPKLKLISKDYVGLTKACFKKVRPIQEDNEKLREFTMKIKPISEKKYNQLEKIGHQII